MRTSAVSASARYCLLAAAGFLLLACVQDKQIPPYRVAYYKQQAWEDGCASAIGAPALGRSSYVQNSLLASTWDQGYVACAGGARGSSPAPASVPASTPAPASPSGVEPDAGGNLPTRGTVVQ